MRLLFLLLTPSLLVASASPPSSRDFLRHHAATKHQGAATTAAATTITTKPREAATSAAVKGTSRPITATPTITSRKLVSVVSGEGWEAFVASPPPAFDPKTLATSRDGQWQVEGFPLRDSGVTSNVGRVEIRQLNSATGLFEEYDSIFGSNPQQDDNIYFGSQVGISADGRYVVTGARGQFDFLGRTAVWERDDVGLRYTSTPAFWNGHRQQASMGAAVAISPDGSKVVGCENGVGHMCYVWVTTDGWDTDEEIGVFEDAFSPNFGPDGLIITDDLQVHILLDGEVASFRQASSTGTPFPTKSPTMTPVSSPLTPTPTASPVVVEPSKTLEEECADFQAKYIAGFEEFRSQCECNDGVVATEGYQVKCRDQCQTCRNGVCFTYFTQSMVNSFGETVSAWYCADLNAEFNNVELCLFATNEDSPVTTCGYTIDNVPCNSCEVLDCAGEEQYILDCSNLGYSDLINTCTGEGLVGPFLYYSGSEYTVGTCDDDPAPTPTTSTSAASPCLMAYSVSAGIFVSLLFLMSAL